jgi:cytochrome c-type biogenesis protein CcsB
VPVDAGLAHLSDTLFTTAIAVYTVALVSYCAEYAFGRRGRVAQTTVPVQAGVGPAGGGPEPGASAVGGAAEAEGLDRAQRFDRIAVACTTLGLLLHAGSVALRGVAVGRLPWGNMYEFSSAVGVVAVAAFLVVLVRQPQVRHLGMFVMLPVVLLMFLAGTVLYAKAGPLVPALRSYWLAIHVSAAIIATGIFLVSFVATVLYLVRERWDRALAAGRQPTRFPTTLGWRLPAADVLDRVAYRTVAFGFPIWTFGIIAGAIWAEAAWGRYWGWDPKETWAFIAWVIYAAYLHARATAGWRGAKAARINLLGFAAMTFNFFVINIVVAGLHSYAGLG